MLLKAKDDIRHTVDDEEGWLGIHRVNDKWISVLGTPLESLGYNQWNSSYHWPDYNCITISSVGPFGLDDFSCDYKFAFICEKPKN